MASLGLAASDTAHDFPCLLGFSWQRYGRGMGAIVGMMGMMGGFPVSPQLWSLKFHGATKNVKLEISVSYFYSYCMTRAILLKILMQVPAHFA